VINEIKVLSFEFLRFRCVWSFVGVWKVGSCEEYVCAGMLMGKDDEEFEFGGFGFLGFWVMGDAGLRETMGHVGHGVGGECARALWGVCLQKKM
jgi:hypothetical protein